MIIDKYRLNAKTPTSVNSSKISKKNTNTPKNAPYTKSNSPQSQSTSELHKSSKVFQ